MSQPETGTREPDTPDRGRVLWDRAAIRLAVLFALWALLPVGLIAGLRGVRGDLLPSPDAWILGLFCLPVLCIWPIVVAHPPWMLVDGRGVWQRHYFRRDLWPREAFAAGAIREGAGPYSWEYPDKPRGYRYMSCGGLAEAERDWLMERIRQVWKPPAVTLPDELTLQARLSVEKTLEPVRGVRVRGLVPVDCTLGLSSCGVVLTPKSGGASRSYAWSDVVRVRGSRFGHWRQDFQDLELELSGRPEGDPRLTLRVGPDGKPANWEGSGAEVVLAYVLHHVGSDRVQFTAKTGPPQTADEVDLRLEDLERSERQYLGCSRAMYGFALFMCCVFCFAAVSRWDAYDWLGSGVVFTGGGLAVAAFAKTCSAELRRIRRCRAELLTRAAGLPRATP